jgi:branched-chain amino acid transport system substrate-binding protein
MIAALLTKTAIEEILRFESSNQFGNRITTEAVTIGGAQMSSGHADTQNKPDVAVAIARRWFDIEGVQAIAEAVIITVRLLCFARFCTAKATSATGKSTTSEFTSKNCSPVSTHWADDTHALAAGTAKALVATRASTWYFITVDIAFGAALQRDAAQVIEANGGKILGSLRHPVETTDFSSFVLQAQGSGAKEIGLISAGNDLVKAMALTVGSFVSQTYPQILAGCGLCTKPRVFGG